MKTRFSFLALLLAAISGFLLPSLQAAPKTREAMAYPVSKVVSSGVPIIKIGDSESTVWHHFGSADREFTENIWGYTGFKADSPQARDDNCDMLVITYQRGRVVDMKLINPRAVRVLVAAATRGVLEHKPIFMVQK